jgi:hypothetical protein
MANELNIALAKSGLTVTAQRYQAGAAVGSAISCPETGSSGFYSGNMTGTAGTYQLAFISASANVGSGSIVWSGTAEVPVSTITTADIPSASISAIQAKTDNLPSDPADQSLVVAAITAIPTVAQIRTELDSNSTKLANLDATVSSRLASSVSTNITSIKAKTDLLNTDRLAQCATTSIVGSLIAQSNS